MAQNPFCFTLLIIFTALAPKLLIAKPATFLQDFHATWSEAHIKQLENGTAIQLLLDQSSGMYDFPFSISNTAFSTTDILVDGLFQDVGLRQRANTCLEGSA